jgi:hypothetical protein
MMFVLVTVQTQPTSIDKLTCIKKIKKQAIYGFNFWKADWTAQQQWRCMWVDKS